MANVAADSDIKTVGANIHSALRVEIGEGDAKTLLIERCIIRDANGKVDLEKSRRAYGYAVRQYLKGKGELSGPPSQAKTVDYTNVLNATLATFLKLATAEKPEVKLPDLIWTTVMALQPAAGDMEKVKAVVRKAMDAEGSPFILKAGARKFDGTMVALSISPSAVPSFHKWGEEAKAADTQPAPAAAPVEAPKADKPKGNGKKK